VDLSSFLRPSSNSWLVAFLPFRQIEGFIKRLSEYIPKLKTIDYSTISICERLKRLDIDLPIENLV